MENSQSFESGRDESRPILTVGAGFAEDMPKYIGTVLEENRMPLLTQQISTQFGNLHNYSDCVSAKNVNINIYLV